MLLSYKAEIEMARALRKLVKKGVYDDVDLVVCPSYVSLAAVSEYFAKLERVEVGAQQVHVEEKGAFTGMVSVGQIAASFLSPLL